MQAEKTDGVVLASSASGVGTDLTCVWVVSNGLWSREKEPGERQPPFPPCPYLSTRFWTSVTSHQDNPSRPVSSDPRGFLPHTGHMNY